jgi:uncharacterized protein (DUF1501 family)
MTRLSRREVLRRAGAIGMSAPLAPFMLNLAAAGRASATGASDYKALVCIFMYGGNDSYNTVLATDTPSWSAYNTERASIGLMAAGMGAQQGSSNFNAQLGGVLPITPANSQGRSFALNPLLGSLRDMFAAGRLGIVANVGPLLRPMSKADYLNPGIAKPAKLFSHNDQQSTWQSFGAEGTTAGWGGKLADTVLTANTQSSLTSISLTANQTSWPSGVQARSYQLAPTGSLHIGASNGTVYGSAIVQQQLLAITSTSSSVNIIEHDHVATVGRSIAGDALLTSTLPAPTAGPWGTSGLSAGATDPKLLYRNPATGVTELNPLALQLQTVARMIAARTSLGMSRQLFFTSLDGFDTHAAQATAHAVCMARLAHAMAYFDSTLTQMGVNPNVTTFTASDFGRNFTSNGTGCDHGWGGHHFVMGAAVKGGDIYGAFPAYGVSDGLGGFSTPSQLGGGALLPTISVDQYAATLGAWFGASATTLLSIMPNLVNFNPRNLGFMS